MCSSFLIETLRAACTCTLEGCCPSDWISTQVLNSPPRTESSGAVQSLCSYLACSLAVARPDTFADLGGYFQNRPHSWHSGTFCVPPSSQPLYIPLACKHFRAVSQSNSSKLLGPVNSRKFFKLAGSLFGIQVLGSPPDLLNWLDFAR